MATRTLTPAATASAQRLVSLDVFRGLTMAAMVVVNNPGDRGAVCAPLHAEWHGWTPTDLYALANLVLLVLLAWLYRRRMFLRV